MLKKDLSLVNILFAALKFIIIFKQRTLYFHFELVLTNYIASPEYELDLVTSLVTNRI